MASIRWRREGLNGPSSGQGSGRCRWRRGRSGAAGSPSCRTESWLTTLATLKAAGALSTHLRAHDSSLAPATVFLLLAVATLVLGLAS